MGTIAVDESEVLGSNSDEAVGGVFSDAKPAYLKYLVPVADALENQEWVTDAPKPGVSLRVEQESSLIDRNGIPWMKNPRIAQIGQCPKSKEI
jgi:hypothetical protein